MHAMMMMMMMMPTMMMNIMTTNVTMVTVKVRGGANDAREEANAIA
jgi:hypothetical protein